jgi:serine/threonine-protein kinase
VKVLRSRFLASEQFGARLRREFEVLRQLKHPNVVQVFDAGETRDHEHYLAMEFLEGRSLSKMVAKYGPLRADMYADILEQIASALDDAHAKGILHRDINPGNIMIVEGPNQAAIAKLLDFGLAKVREPDKTKQMNMTGAGVILGNVAFMSPEQSRGQKLNAATDIYALAATSYFALTGEAPFTHRVEIDVMLAHAKEPVPPFSRKNPNNNVPAAAEKVIRGGMEKSAADRPPSAGEFAARFREALGLTAHRPVATKQPAHSNAPAPRFGKWAVVLVVALALGIGLALFFTHFRS